MKKQKKGRRKCLLSKLLDGAGYLLISAMIVVFARSMLEVLLLGELDMYWVYVIIALFFGVSGIFWASAIAQETSYNKHK